MENTSYQNLKCCACEKLVEEQGKYVYEISIYKQKYVKGYGYDTKIEIQPLNYTDLNLFCEICVNEEKAIELIYKNFNDNSSICRLCKKITDYLESIEWAVTIAKMDIAESIGCFAPVWTENLYNYCQECGRNQDLYIDAYECIQEILNSKIRNNFKPYEGTFIPSQL